MNLPWQIITIPIQNSMFKPRNPEDWAAGALDAATGKNVARRARKEEPLAYIVKLQVAVAELKLLGCPFGLWGSFDELTDTEMVIIHSDNGSGG